MKLNQKASTKHGLTSIKILQEQDEKEPTNWLDHTENTLRRGVISIFNRFIDSDLPPPEV
jgi:hypothetical protein